MCAYCYLSFICVGQACRGADYDDGVDVAVVPGADNNDHGDDDEEVDASEEIDDGGCQLRPKKVIISHAPIFKDFLVMYATTPGRLDIGTLLKYNGQAKL